jgi:type VI secretion system protein ImpI
MLNAVKRLRSQQERRNAPYSCGRLSLDATVGVRWNRFGGKCWGEEVASSLTLEVSGPDARRLGSASRKVFTTSGGTIGRLPDNAWVLPDQHISGRHAVIRYSNGTFYLVDTSSNGVFVNSPESRLQKNQPYALKQGDRLYIDAYEIRVSIQTESRPEPRTPEAPMIPDDPFADDVGGETAAPLHVQPVPLRSMPSGGRQEASSPFSPLPNTEVDPMALLGLSSAPKAAGVPKAEDLLRGSPLSDAYRPPAVRISEVSAGASLIPAGYNPLAGDDVSARPTPPPLALIPTPVAAIPIPVVANATTLEPAAPRAHTTSTDEHVEARVDARSNTDFAALLAAAGIENAAVTPEVIESFGRILRIVVSGTMDLLRVREGVKDEFRMKMTTFKASDNNPLKFSANVEDALHNLLVKRNAAYLPPVDAFRDAFQDARNHQVAMFEGLRAAFESMLRDFDPDVLEEKFDKQVKGSLLPGRRKYWELYRDWYESVGKDADSAFRTLFGEEFARAYEEQLQRLKNSGRSPGNH